MVAGNVKYADRIQAVAVRVVVRLPADERVVALRVAVVVHINIVACNRKKTLNDPPARQ